MIYEHLINALKEAVSSNDKKMIGQIRSLILLNFKGSSTLAEVRSIVKKYDQNIVDNSGGDGLTFSLDDFEPEKKKKVVPSIQVVAEDNNQNTTVIGNVYKKILENTDEELKFKFDNDISSAVEFLNNIRDELNLEPVEFKSFSKKFFETFRATLSNKLDAKNRDTRKDT